MYSQRSTIPANFVKIGPVDVEIIGLTEITELFFKLKKIGKTYSPPSAS